MQTFISRSIEETQKIANQFVTSWHGGEVVFLQGGLGSGKTAFTQGVAKALMMRRPVQSPTFVLMREYFVPKKHPGSIRRLVHIDAYRFHSAQELHDIGWAEFAGQNDTITLVENPSVLNPLIRPSVSITFDVISTNTRKLCVHYTRGRSGTSPFIRSTSTY